MGLLEKAGKKKEEIKPKKAAKKAKKTEPKPAKQAKAAKAKPKKEARERKPRDPRVMPDDFQHAGRAAKGARRLVDVIVTYAGIIALLGFTATGSNFNPTLFLLGALIPLSLNMIILPLKTNRTVGMFLTRTRFVNSRGNHPNWTHLFFSNMTTMFLLSGLAVLLMGTAELSDPATKSAGTSKLAVGAVLLLIPIADYVVTKLRVANGQKQNMYDAIYGCWFVVAERNETEGSRWMSRLESLGDWGEKKGWSGSADEDEDDASND
jgi:hypothetical protein